MGEPAGAFVISSHAALGSAAREVRRLAARLRFGPADQWTLATVASELMTNMLRYAGFGELRAWASEESDGAWLWLEARDAGPGIPDLEQALEEGFSTGGGLGLGLAAVRRGVDVFEVQTSPGSGTAVRVGKRAGRRARVAAGWSVRPLLDAARCGDTFVACRDEKLLRVVIADVLGHGKEARGVAATIEAFFRNSDAAGAAELLMGIHEHIRGTRGAAVSVCVLDRVSRRLEHCAAGNTHVRVCGREETTLVSRAGIVGQIVPRALCTEVRLEPGDRLVLLTDGVSSRFRWSELPELHRLAPSAIARALVERFGRPSDDACCGVVEVG